MRWTNIDLYSLGVVMIVTGFVLTAVSAYVKSDWKNMVVAVLFAIGNAVIFLWK